MSQQKPPLIVKIGSSLSTAIFDCLLIVSCQAQLGEISQRHHHANPMFSINMLSHTVVGRHAGISRDPRLHHRTHTHVPCMLHMGSTSSRSTAQTYDTNVSNTHRTKYRLPVSAHCTCHEKLHTCINEI